MGQGLLPLTPPLGAIRAKKRTRFARRVVGRQNSPVLRTREILAPDRLRSRTTEFPSTSCLGDSATLRSGGFIHAPHNNHWRLGLKLYRLKVRSQARSPP